MITRVCTKCSEEKPLNAFSRSSAGRQGFHTFCKPCKAAQTRAWMKRNRETLRAKQRAAHAAKPALRRERGRAWYWANKDRAKHAKRLHKMLRYYGLTGPGYDAIFEAQGGACRICAKTPEQLGDDLVVDHDHATGQVRGLLCRRCNIGLGHFEDSCALLGAATDYLDEHVARIKRIA